MKIIDNAPELISHVNKSNINCIYNMYALINLAKKHTIRTYTLCFNLGKKHTIRTYTLCFNKRKLDCQLTSRTGARRSGMRQGERNCATIS